MTNHRDRIIAARERLGLTREQMAERLLEPHATYEQWEQDTIPVPGSAVVAAEAIASRVRSSSSTQVRKLADGTRTVQEIAAEIGCRPVTVYRHLQLLRAAGVDVSVHKNLIRDQVVALADGSRTIDEIAVAIGISRNNVSTAIHTARRLGMSPAIRDLRYGHHNESRDAEIAAQVAAGITLKAAGAPYGLTRERVRQICERLGVWSDKNEVRFQVAAEKAAEKAAARTAVQQKRAAKFRHGLDLVAGGMSIRRAAAIIGFNENALAKHVAKSGVESKYGRWHGRGLLARISGQGDKP